MVIDVTDATFMTDVVEKSKSVAVVVDLWAPWCGPCKQLTPILERVIGATDGQVILAKVNVDDNPQVAQQFQVQSIPAVFGIKDGRVVGSFLGAKGEGEVVEFVSSLLPTETETEISDLIAAGDEASLRKVLETEPGNAVAVVALAELLVAGNQNDEALALLERIPETPETKRIAALARSGAEATKDIELRLDGLLDQVKNDEDARQTFLDLLEIMGPGHPRTADYRRKLTARLF